MELSFRPLDGPFGVEVQGVDLGRNITESAVHALDTALTNHQVLLFRNQALADERLNEVASLFGEVRALPGGYIGDENVFGVRHLTNLGPDNKPTGVHPERWSKVWHTDGGFSQPPAKATLLYSIEASRLGGATQFADMYGGLGAFTEFERRRLEALDAIHDQELARVFRFGRAVVENRNLTRWRRFTRWCRFFARMLPGGTTVHPLVYFCKDSGRSAIILGSDIWRVRGMGLRRGMRAVEELEQRAIREELILTLFSQPGDVMLWDNRSLLHRVTDYDLASDVRIMRQVVIMPRQGEQTGRDSLRERRGQE